MIATHARKTYLHAMLARRLVRILTMLAMLFAPLGMVGGHAAMAMPAAAAASHHEPAADQAPHCAEMSGEAEEDSTGPASDMADCAVACAAIPVRTGAMTDQPLGPALARPLPLDGLVRGLNPESDDPPPRTA